MKNIYRLFALAVVALVFATSPGNAANNPANIPNIPSIAAMQALGAASPQYATINLQSYYAGLNKGGGIFQWAAGSTATGDTCTIFAASGVSTGRWIRQGINALDITMCGAYADGSHADQAAITQAGVVASTSPYKTVTLPGGHIIISSSITAATGVIYRGQGMGAPGATLPGQTWVDGATMTSGWVFDLTTPIGGATIEAPKFYDMTIYAPVGGTPSGGCIRWNSISGGFTNDASSQAAMLHPHAERIYCRGNGNVGNTVIGMQCSKCFEGDISQSIIQFGATGVDFEGSDMMSFGGAGPNRIQTTNGYPVILQGHNTFGNRNLITGNEILYPNPATGTVGAMIYDAAGSSTIQSNHIESSGAPTITCIVDVAGGVDHSIVNNDITVVSPTNSWCVDGDLPTLAIQNNGCSACSLPAALFPAGGSHYFYNNGGIRQIITHGGNSPNADSGFPFNSVPSNSDITFPANVVLQWSCGNSGLTTGGAGLLVTCDNGAFSSAHTGTGSGNYLLFNSSGRTNVTGTLNLLAQASSASGGQICGQIFDNVTGKGNTCQVLTASPLWYTIRSGDVVATSTSAEFYFTTADVKLYAAQVTN